MAIFSKTLGSLDYGNPASVKTIANHLRSMQEELEYRLAHLDSANINEINMDETQVFCSKGGLIQLLNETDESIANLSVKEDEISQSVESLDGRYTELKTSIDGVTVTDATGTTLIKGSSIETGSLVLTGSITFSDLDSSVQNAINSAGGISEAQAQTIITRTLVSSPSIVGANIYGGAFWDPYQEVQLILNNRTGYINAYSSLLIRNKYGTDAFEIGFSGSDDRTSLTSYGYTFLQATELGDECAYPQGTWDFRGAAVIGITATFA